MCVMDDVVERLIIERDRLMDFLEDEDCHLEAYDNGDVYLVLSDTSER